MQKCIIYKQRSSSTPTTTLSGTLVPQNVSSLNSNPLPNSKTLHDSKHSA